MPSPAAHALGGLATAFLVDSVRRRPVLTPALLIVSAAAAMFPDLDLLAGSHRTYSHSIGAIFIVGVASWIVIAARRLPNAFRTAVIVAAAYGSHLVFDWMGKDTSMPPGVTALWPFSSGYYLSGWDVFREISRRYWLPHEFIIRNLIALAWELTLLVPVLVVAWIVWSKRTVD